MIIPGTGVPASGPSDLLIEGGAIARIGRATKDWPAADAVRDTLKTLGLKVADTPAGPRWSLEN